MSQIEELVVANTRPFPAGTYCVENPNNLPPGFCGSGLLDAKAALDAALVASPPSASGGGGGCTAAPDGQADASLLLIALLSLGLAMLRRRNR